MNRVSHAVAAVLTALGVSLWAAGPAWGQAPESSKTKNSPAAPLVTDTDQRGPQQEGDGSREAVREWQKRKTRKDAHQPPEQKKPEVTFEEWKEWEQELKEIGRFQVIGVLQGMGALVLDTKKGHVWQFKYNEDEFESKYLGPVFPEGLSNALKNLEAQGK